MNQKALEKKRENDRNAQRNIREKAKRHVEDLENKIKMLEASQNAVLERKLRESEERNKKLIEALLRHGIDVDQVLSSNQEPSERIPPNNYNLNSWGYSDEIPKDPSSTMYQGQQHSPNTQPMYSLGLTQPLPMIPQQALPPGNFPYGIGSPPNMESHIESPQHTASPVTPSASDTFSQRQGSPQFAIHPQSMGAIPHHMASNQQMRQSQQMPFYMPHPNGLPNDMFSNIPANMGFDGNMGMWGNDPSGML